MPSPSPPVPDSNTDMSLNESFDRFRQQTFDRITSLQTKVSMSERSNEDYFQQIIKLEALVAEKESELDAVRSEFNDHRDTSQKEYAELQTTSRQEYAELQATSQQLIDKLQKEIVGVTAQKDKAERKLGLYAYAYHQSFTPPKALAENGSDASKEQPVDESATSGVLAVSSLVASPPAEGRTSLQNEHFKKSGDEDEEVADNEHSAFKRSVEVAGDEDSEEDTSSPPASPSKKSEEEDVIQDDIDMTAAPKNSDDEGEEFDENESGAKEEDEDKDAEEDAKEDGEDEEDGKNVDTLLPITENQPVEAQDLKLTTPDKKFIEDKCDEDDDGFATPSEDMGEVTTQDTGTQTPRSLRKSKRCSKTSPKKTSSSTKKLKRAVRNQ